MTAPGAKSPGLKTATGKASTSIDSQKATGKISTSIDSQTAKAALFADLRKMINDPEYSDVLFKCQDGVHICASRMLVMARSTMLKNILTLKENRETQISLPDITSSTFLSILEFLYTGELVQYSPFSSVKAYEIIRAARFFQLPKVEEIVTEFLTASTSEADDDIAKAALKLSVALEFGSHAGSYNAIPASLVQQLSSSDLKPTQLRALTEKAFRYYLFQTRTAATSPGSLSLGEFIRFRLVILWCVTQICPDEAIDAVAALIPEPRTAVAILQRDSKPLSPRQANGLDTGHGFLKSLLTKRQESAAIVNNLLELVDFRRIHTELLNQVVEPLKIVSEGQLMEAYRFQALSKSPKPPQYTWEHGSSYMPLGNGSVLAKYKAEVGFARYPVPIFRNFGVYEWAIVVEELCVDFCEIGFLTVDASQGGKPDFNGSSLTSQPTGWALSMDIEQGTRVNQKGVGNGGWVPFQKDFAHKDARVNVRLDMEQRSCSFSVDNDEHLVAYAELPSSTVYYPAVSLGAGTQGRVRIDLVSGFDLL